MYQTEPQDPRTTLPTMYDLPSEDPTEPGLPDQFHLLQPRLLDETFAPEGYDEANIFTGSDLNLYYDVRQTNWYKRPDWFGVVGVDQLYEKRDLRMSYVIWQEGVSPVVAVELISPGTEKEDLGQALRDADQPPTKWEIYERILRIPYYVVYDRYTEQLRAFQLQGSRYEPVEIPENKLWIEDLGIGLGLWQGEYQGINRHWLRWGDRQNNWIPCKSEMISQSEQDLATEKEKNARLTAQLRALGIEPEV